MNHDGLKGISTALVTPFLKGKVDYDSLKKLIQHQISGGIRNLVIFGTTGESGCLSKEEKNEILKFILKDFQNDINLILGAGGNCTESVQAEVKWGLQYKPKAFLSVVPYYNKPPQRGLVQHYKKVAEAAEKTPVILYNVPSRTITALELSSIEELAKVPNIVGIKEASGDIKFDEKIREKLKDFLLLSGDDGTFVQFLYQAKGDGCVSVISNLLPQMMRDLWLSQPQSSGIALTEKWSTWSKLNQYLYLEANPIPVKFALKKMGLIQSDELRLPLVNLEGEAAVKLTAELKATGLIS